MNRLAGFVVVSLCLTLSASVALGQKCADTEEPTLQINLGNNTFSYPDKGDVSKPSICRNNRFFLEVTFSDASIKKVVFKNFRPTFTKKKEWRKKSSPQWEDDYKITVALPEGTSDFPYTVSGVEGYLPTTWTPPGVVKVRIILVTAEITLQDGTAVTFDPPWAERP